ncbi:ABC transporter substrate-binding protein [Rhizobium helianthi]|uniref:ABC transporter substrate-binding protein n=1 Tax=Rhizobium helianthi TaxID=1132695 RepID=A0ABW4M0F5_9HYPH
MFFNSHTIALLTAFSLTGLLTSGTAAFATSDTGSTDTVVIIDGDILGRYNPILGHGRNGDSHIYQGLYRVETGVFDRQPALLPKLAAGPAVATEQNRVWTVPLRQGVTFSDGTTFGPEDVVATFKALLDPRSASSEIAGWDNIEKVEAAGDSVRFTLKTPLAEFDRRLLNVIAPSEAFDFDKLGPAEDSPLNSKPVGTGPYVLSELRSDEAILVAREDYWGPQPEVRKIVIRHTADENARAQQLRAGEGDGTLLVAELAQTFKEPEFAVVSVRSADWRGITLPAGNPVTADDAVRLAVNLAVNRENMVKYVMKGHAVANSTFLAPFYGDAYDPSLEFPFDPGAAIKILEEAGWKPGPDGIRTKNGQRASFQVIYFPNRDRARRDLTLAAASDLKKIGVELIPVARDSKAVTADMYSHTPVMLGGGGIPYSLDGQIFRILHSSYAAPGAGAKWDNGSDYRNPQIDTLLETARRTADQGQQNELYRAVQREYRTRPAMLQLVYVNHVYVKRAQGFKGADGILEPHTHGVNFGPWYAIEDWRR